MSNSKDVKIAHSRSENLESFDVFLSHSGEDAAIVECLGAKLADNAHLRVWLDKWILVPGCHWQQEMSKGLEQAKTCAVCIGQVTPSGWYREEIQKALNRQVKDPTFRVIPIILPNGDGMIIDSFLELRTWVDFNKGLENGYAFHLLTCGIRGEPPGRYQPNNVAGDSDLESMRGKLHKIKSLRDERLIDPDVAIDAQRHVIDEILGG